MTVPLRPCWVCRQPVPDGRCDAHPNTARQYRPARVGYDGVHRALRAMVLERDGATCGYCGRYAHTVDHIVPRSKGGLTMPDNLIACCRECNGSKKDRTLAEWIASGSAPIGALRVLERMSAA